MIKSEIDTDLSKLFTIARRVGSGYYLEHDVKRAINSWPWFDEYSRDIAYRLAENKSDEETNCIRDMVGLQTI